MEEYIPELFDDLMRSFRKDNVILFVGTEAAKRGELTPEICALPWRCVVTTLTDPMFIERFSEERKPTAYTCFTGESIDIFNKQSLPVIFLNGRDGESYPELEQLNDRKKKAYTRNQSQKIITRIMTKMDIRTKMVFVGYEPENETEMEDDVILFAADSMQGGRLEFFNTSEIAEEDLKDWCLQRGYLWHDVTLSEAYADREEEEEEEQEEAQEGTQLLYKNQKPVFAPTTLLSRINNYSVLLTEEVIYKERPLGKVLQSRKFYDFLDSSSDKPQWYGYLPESEFYMKRDYEDCFVDLVRNLLDKKKMTIKDVNPPVILEGRSGSSKSVELAALAYRIFTEKNYPVLYISSEKQATLDTSSAVHELDQLMYEVDQLGDQESRFLIVWDCSSYRSVVEEAKQVIQELMNRGRRFVLVCSAYDKSDGIGKDTRFKSYKYNGETFLPTDKEQEADVIRCNDCYFVRAERDLSEGEIESLKNKSKTYTMVDPGDLDRLWDSLNAETDIFRYWYDLITLIRPKLLMGLSKEQQVINGHMVSQLKGMSKKRSDEGGFNTFAEQLKKLNLFNLELADEEEEENSDYDFDRFERCIALFSWFKLDTPYSLALQMLCKNEDDYFGKNSDYNNHELFDLLTSQIGYIHYIEGVDGHNYFHFHNSLEAEHYLAHNNVGAEQIIQLISDMFGYYSSEFNRTREVDENVKAAIISLLRMIGPNSEFPAFWNGAASAPLHQELQKKLDVLIEEMSRLRTGFRVEDSDRGFALSEVSFTREFYGTQWDGLHSFNKDDYPGYEPWEILPEAYNKESYELRMKKLGEALDLANESLDYLGRKIAASDQIPFKRSAQRTMNNLTVELTTCNRILDKVLEDYARLMKIEKPTRGVFKTLDYDILYQRLYQAINADPLNGYLYIALFRSFLVEYERCSGNQERQVFLINEIRFLVDDAGELEIRSRGPHGTDELTPLITKITQLSGSVQVSIDDVENDTMPEQFKKLYDKLLAKNSPSAICFIAQQELDAAGLSRRDVRSVGENVMLTEEQLAVCEKVLTFMTKKDFQPCIDRSTQALYMLFKVQWMYFNKCSLNRSKEWQRTYISKAHWSEILNTCMKYETLSLNSVRPIITLVYALALIHTNSDFSLAARLTKKLHDMASNRMRVPYTICNEDGTPVKFSGTVLNSNQKDHNGTINVHNYSNLQARFWGRNLGYSRDIPATGELIKDFEIGLSYTGSYHARKNAGGED